MEQEFCDFWGLPVRIGDTIAYNTTGGKAGINIASEGVVTGFTRRMNGTVSHVLAEHPVTRGSKTWKRTYALAVYGRSFFVNPYSGD